MPTTILHIVNIDVHFHKHLMPVVKGQVAAGHAVHAAGAITDANVVAQIEAAGIAFHPIPFNRGSIMPWHMVREWWATARLLRKLQPDVVRTSTWKPLCAVGMTRSFVDKLRVHYAIPGLGYMFLNQSLKARVARSAMTHLLRVIAQHPKTCFEVLNSDDRDWLRGIVGNEVLINTLSGLGVDSEYYHALPQPPSPPFVFVLPARLLWDKGIAEFVSAARTLHEANAPVHMVLVGALDHDNPSCIAQSDLDAWQAEGILEYWGYVADIRTVWAKAHVCVLPSYREGLNMALIEAACCARALITSDVGGCRETVIAGETGWLVPPHNAAALVEAILHYTHTPELIATHGQAGCVYAQTTFDVRHAQEAFVRQCYPVT